MEVVDNLGDCNDCDCLFVGLWRDSTLSLDWVIVMKSILLIAAGVALMGAGNLIAQDGFGVGEFFLAFIGFALLAWRDELLRGK